MEDNQTRRTIKLHKDAKKFLANADKATRNRLLTALDNLSGIPPTGDIKPLQGSESTLRARIGKYRIIFKIENNTLLVRDIDSRGQVYKGGF
jgi:mRNA interferase RelE/StbE